MNPLAGTVSIHAFYITVRHEHPQFIHNFLVLPSESLSVDYREVLAGLYSEVCLARDPEASPDSEARARNQALNRAQPEKPSLAKLSS